MTYVFLGTAAAVGSRKFNRLGQEAEFEGEEERNAVFGAPFARKDIFDAWLARFDLDDWKRIQKRGRVFHTADTGDVEAMTRRSYLVQNLGVPVLETREALAHDSSVAWVEENLVGEPAEAEGEDS